VKRAAHHPSTVVEWGPKSVGVLDPTSRSVRRFDSAQQAAGLIGPQAVAVAVSRRALFIRTMRVPNAAPSEIDLIVRMKLGEMFPLPPQDTAYSIELTQDIGSEGRLAVVVAMSAIELRRLHEEMRSAGFRVQTVVPLAYGSVALAQNLNLKSGAVASRDESGIGIDILQDGILRYSRVAPATGNAAAEVCRTYSVAGIPCAEIVAADGLLIDEADVVSAISPLEALSGIWPSFVPTIELPEAVVQRTAKRRASSLRLSVMLFLAGVLFAGTQYLNYSDALAKANSAKAAMDASLKRLKSIESDVEKRSASAVIAESVLKRGFEPAQKMSDVITLASNAAPAQVWLSGITLERGKQLLIRGTATDTAAVSAYLQNLSNLADPVTGVKSTSENRLRDVKLVFTNNAKIDETPVILFSITATPVGNVPLTEKIVKKGGAK
jgi:Tfp pilus assembly protein PilN